MNITEATARCWAEIDLDALEYNYKSALSLLSPGCRLICVLKANAYGLGAKEVCRFLSELGADYFAVACMSEAEEIRSCLPNADVMVLGAVCESECLRAIEKNITLTCWSPESARMMAACATDAKKTLRLQIKADTGLHRIGFDASTRESFLNLIKCPNIRIEGLYTHLALHNALSDEKQFRLLDEWNALLKTAGLDSYRLHACDSIGMVRYPERHMGAVRTGAWLYGVCPSGCPYPELCRPTVEFKTRVSDLHDVAAGEYIGYDDDHPLTRSGRVATLSAGYVDGFPRFNNRGEVLIRGQRAKVLGLVCMDQMMVDVTDIPDVSRGDEVILLGKELWVDEYARVAGLNRNESLCRIGRRVPRVYLRSGNVRRIRLELAE